jgi:ribonuclease HI
VDNAEQTTRAVVYTDGGHRSQWDCGGYGAHGYITDGQLATKGDGSKVTPTLGGYLDHKDKNAHVQILQYFDLHGPLTEATNNIAEVQAAIRSLEALFEQRETYNLTYVLILSDSKYLVQGVNENLAKWSKNQWRKADGEEIANKDRWQTLHQWLETFRQHDIVVEMNWVKGHSTDLGNQYADLQATRGLLLAEKGYTEETLLWTDPKGYWSHKADPAKLLAKGYWYFTTNSGIPMVEAEEGDYTVYFLGNHKEDAFLGKPISDGSFGVVYLRTPDPVLECVRAHQNTAVPLGEQRLFIADLAKLRQPYYYRDICDHEDRRIYVRPEREAHLYSADHTRLTREMRPARRSFQVLEHLAFLQWVLECYRTESSLLPIQSTDITSYFYETTTDKKDREITQLRSDVETTQRSLRANVTYQVTDAPQSIEMDLVLNVDLPSRNTLNAIAAKSPQVMALTWRNSDAAFRYATVVYCDEGIGIYSSLYSNLYVVEAA